MGVPGPEELLFELGDGSLAGQHAQQRPAAEFDRDDGKECEGDHSRGGSHRVPSLIDGPPERRMSEVPSARSQTVMTVGPMIVRILEVAVGSPAKA